MDKIELLSKYLFDIHNKQLTPFYNEANPSNWLELVDVSNDKNEVDKAFFRTIAKDITIKYKSNPNFRTQLPRLLYEIHSSILPPYYVSIENYEIYLNDKDDDRAKNNWTTLEEATKDTEQVDKNFFREIAKYILNTLTIDT